MEAKNLIRGDVTFVDLGEYRGSVQGGVHPCIVVQNNIGNAFSQTIIVVPLTSKVNKKSLPTHVFIPQHEGGLKLNSIALCEQIATVDKSAICSVIGHLSDFRMEQIDSAMRVSVGL